MPPGCESNGPPSLPSAESQGVSLGNSRDKFPAIGAVVSLKSGGPRMMVVDYVDKGLTVSWRDDGRVVESSLPVACLEIASPL
jgi:uncharacterized protein YodC (DUF2158 family)